MSELAVNRRATFDYEIFEKFEAGIELKGFEVKSVAAGRANLAGAHAIIRNGEAWLVNLDIPPYQPNNTPSGYDPERTRRLLLNRSEISALIGKTKEKGLTLVPLKMYHKNGKIKVEIGLGRNRKKADKRDIIRKREVAREIREGF